MPLPLTLADLVVERVPVLLETGTGPGFAMAMNVVRPDRGSPGPAVLDMATEPASCDHWGQPGLILWLIVDMKMAVQLP